MVREGDVRGDSFVAFATGQANAQFLFGREVRDYLQDLRKNFALISSYRDEVIDASPQREKLIDKKYDALQRIANFYNDSSQMFGPYIELTHKITPFWRPW